MEEIQVYGISTYMHVSVVISSLYNVSYSSHRILSKSGEVQQLVFAFNSHENSLTMRLLLGVTEDQGSVQIILQETVTIR